MHLFADISSHGFGHLAITAPVLNTLAASTPGLRLTVRSALPEYKLRSRIRVPFDGLPLASDFGFAMHDATRVDLPATASRYRLAHQNWPQKVQAEADFLAGLSPDLVLSNVSYLPLAGAQRAGVPAAAICSLNWADLFRHFFVAGTQPEDWAVKIHAEMLAAYQAADCFLRITPGMPMTALKNVYPVGVVAAQGRCQARPGQPGEKWVLVAMGGIRHRLPVENWPVLPGVRWLVAEDWAVSHPQATAFESLGWSFTDLLASVDAVVTKPGYGTFTEAVCNGTPVIFQRRDDWPEQDCLIDWVQTHGRAIEVSESDLLRGALGQPLQQVWQKPARAPVAVEGARQAAEILHQLAARRRPI